MKESPEHFDIPIIQNEYWYLPSELTLRINLPPGIFDHSVHPGILHQVAHNNCSAPVVQQHGISPGEWQIIWNTLVNMLDCSRLNKAASFTKLLLYVFTSVHTNLKSINGYFDRTIVCVYLWTQFHMCMGFFNIIFLCWKIGTESIAQRLYLSVSWMKQKASAPDTSPSGSRFNMICAKISWSLDAARFMFRIVRSLYISPKT